MNIQAFLIDQDSKIHMTKELIFLVHRLKKDNETLYELIKNIEFQTNKLMREDVYRTIGTNLTRMACIENRLGFRVEP